MSQLMGKRGPAHEGIFVIAAEIDDDPSSPGCGFDGCTGNGGIQFHLDERQAEAFFDQASHASDRLVPRNAKAFARRVRQGKAVFPGRGILVAVTEIG